MASKWSGNAWGVVVDPHTFEWDFRPAWNAGASFIVAPMNWTHDQHNIDWVNVVSQPYQYQRPLIGLYNLEVSAYHKHIADYGYYPLHDHVSLEDDVVWMKLASLVKDKWMQAIIIKFTDFTNQNGDPIPGPHVLAIVESAIKRVKENIAKVNPRIKVVIPMIDERIIMEQYPDLGGIMAKEPYCFSDLVLSRKIVNLPDWTELQQYYPPDRPIGYDGKEHSGPPWAFTQGWWGWLFAPYNFVSPDFKRPEGMGVMGAALYNGTPEELYAELGIGAVIDPEDPPDDDEPTAPGDPEPVTLPNIVPELSDIAETLEVISAEFMGLKQSINDLITKLEEYENGL